MRRIQKFIARSRMAMPVTSVIVTLFWFVAWLLGHSTVLTYVVIFCSAMLLMWINHLFALLRVYSRMIASAFLAVSSAFVITPDLSNYSVLMALGQFCILVFLLLLFSCYQYKKAAGVIFYAFLMIGLTSVFYKQILFFVPLLWALTAYCMMTSNSKIVLSSVFGLLLPYVYITAYYLFFEGVGSPMPLLHNWDFCRIADFSSVEWPAKSSFLMVSALMAFGINHYVREGHKDKVRTRMMYHILIYMGLYAFLLTLIQPRQMEMMLGVMIVTVSTLLGHYITFTETRASNIVFQALMAAAVVISVVNLVI